MTRVIKQIGRCTWSLKIYGDCEVIEVMSSDAQCNINWKTTQSKQVNQLAIREMLLKMLD